VLFMVDGEWPFRSGLRWDPGGLQSDQGEKAAKNAVETGVNMPLFVVSQDHDGPRRPPVSPRVRSPGAGLNHPSSSILMPMWLLTAGCGV